MGGAYLGAGKQEPSRDFFEFEGTLSRAAVAGALRHSDRLRTGGPPASRRIKLSRQTGDAMTALESYDEWKRMCDGVLNRFREFCSS